MVGIKMNDVCVFKLFNAQFKHPDSCPLPTSILLINIVPTCQAFISSFEQLLKRKIHCFKENILEIMHEYSFFNIIS